METMNSTYKLVCILSLLSLGTFVVSGESYGAKAENAFGVLQQWYNPDNGLWATMGWWNAANGMTAIAGLASAQRHHNTVLFKNLTSVFNTTYVNGPSANPDFSCNGWCSIATDDEGWWALAWIAAYDVTHKQEYLTIAENVFQNMSDGRQTECNGGMYWGQDNTYVNAITNEIYLSLAAHLANRPTSNSTMNYTSIAQEWWTWFNASGMINEYNLINDGLTDSCTNNNETVWTYNQGVILGGLVELHKAVHNNSYLASAHILAQAAIANLTDENMVLHEKGCENTCDGDQTQFKGIFVRNLLKLYLAEPKDLYKKFILANAHSIWEKSRNSTSGQLGLNWSELLDDENASTHSSALDALVAAILV